MILANYKLYLKSSRKIQSAIKCNVVYVICVQMLLYIYILTQSLNNSKFNN